jgi:hypothetical protein
MFAAPNIGLLTLLRSIASNGLHAPVDSTITRDAVPLNRPSLTINSRRQARRKNHGRLANHRTLRAPEPTFFSRIRASSQQQSCRDMCAEKQVFRNERAARAALVSALRARVGRRHRQQRRSREFADRASLRCIGPDSLCSHQRQTSRRAAGASRPADRSHRSSPPPSAAGDCSSDRSCAAAPQRRCPPLRAGVGPCARDRPAAIRSRQNRHGHVPTRARAAHRHQRPHALAQRSPAAAERGGRDHRPHRHNRWLSRGSTRRSPTPARNASADVEAKQA